MHGVRQWGITDADLKNVMTALGFKQIYERDCGEWLGVEEIRNKAFVFERTTKQFAGAQGVPVRE
jgi:hypothetical protein